MKSETRSLQKNWNEARSLNGGEQVRYYLVRLS